MTLKNEIVGLFDKADKLRFMGICNKTRPKNKDRKSWSVQVSNCLNELRQGGLLTRQYVDRESWYSITEEGRSFLRKLQATTEIAQSPGFAFLNCELVKSPNGQGDASVYSNDVIDPFTRRQIASILRKYPGIKILGHGE